MWLTGEFLRDLRSLRDLLFPGDLLATVPWADLGKACCNRRIIGFFVEQSNFGATKSVSWCKYVRSLYCWISRLWFTDILAQVTKGSLCGNGEMQWIIFFQKKMNQCLVL